MENKGLASLLGHGELLFKFQLLCEGFAMT